jgi:Meiotically up-regulated gene 113
VSENVVKLRRRPGLRDGTPSRQRKGEKQRYATRKSRSITYIYIFRCGEFHKVGISRDPSARLVEMQNHCPLPIEAVAYRRVPNKPLYYERLIHTMLREHRMHGEWFKAPLGLIRDAIEDAFLVLQKPARQDVIDRWVGTPDGTGQAVHNG